MSSSFVHVHHETLPSTYLSISRDPLLSEYVQLLKTHQVVLLSCDYQTAGVGTYGADGKRREWVPEGGNFFGSFLLKVPTSAVRSLNADVDNDGQTCLEGLPSVLGAAIALELRKLSRMDVKMKYPNDLVVGYSKIGGMFCDLPRTDKGFAVFQRNSSGTSLSFESNLVGLPEDAYITLGLHLGVNLRTPSAVESLAGSLKLEDRYNLNDVTRTLLDLLVNVAKSDWHDWLSALERRVADEKAIAGLGEEVDVQHEITDSSSTRMLFTDFSLARGSLKLESHDGSKGGVWSRPRTVKLVPLEA